MKKINPWQRASWGVVLDAGTGRQHLVGRSWSKRVGAYGDEPDRALLFCTRAQARAWCAEENWKWASFRVRPVRVVEKVTVTGRVK